jgi:hypothetical protein
MSVFYFIQDILWRLNHIPNVLHLNSDCFLAQLLEEQVIFFLKIKQRCKCNPERNKINVDETELQFLPNNTDQRCGDGKVFGVISSLASKIPKGASLYIASDVKIRQTASF